MPPLLPTSARSAKGPRESRTFQPLRNPPKGYISPHSGPRAARADRSCENARVGPPALVVEHPSSSVGKPPSGADTPSRMPSFRALDAARVALAAEDLARTAEDLAIAARDREIAAHDLAIAAQDRAIAAERRASIVAHLAAFVPCR